MQHRLATLVAAFVFAGSVGFVAACPDEEKHGNTGTTVAHDGKAPCSKAAGKPCHSKDSTVASSESTGDSRVDAVLAKLPKMLYRVGGETTCCEKTAAAMAEKTGKPMQYVIGEEVFEDHCTAEVKFTAVLEKELENLAAMQFAVGGDCVRCPVTAKEMAKKGNATVAYRVGGVDFKSQEQADKAAQLVGEAVDGVKLTYKVDGQSFCCDKMAGMKVKESGKPITFVVGADETSCEKHAKLLLAQAKVRAAVQTALTALSS